MIKNVVEICTHRELHSLRDLETLPHREVGIEESRPGVLVAHLYRKESEVVALASCAELKQVLVPYTQLGGAGTSASTGVAVRCSGLTPCRRELHNFGGTC
jgi:hypothetical protein